MIKEESKLTVVIEHPEPTLTDEQQADLKKRLENALVHFFPEQCEKGEVTIISRPRITSH